MQWTALVPYRGGKACYEVKLDRNHFFQAELVSYDGSLDFDPPPQKLILFKGVKGWVGSAHNVDLLNELGRNIDLLYTSEDFLTVDQYHVRQRSNNSPEAAS